MGQKQSSSISKKEIPKYPQVLNVDDMIQSFHPKPQPKHVAVDKQKEKASKIDTTKEVMKPKKSRSKIQHDPNLPKKPPGSYLLFQKDYKPRVLESNPSINQLISDTPLAELAKILGKQWKKLDPTQKNKYQNMFKVAKKKYDDDMEAYKRNHPDYEQPKRKRKPEAHKETSEEASCILSDDERAQPLEIDNSLAEDM